MAHSQRRKQQRDSKRARKLSSMSTTGGASTYALKHRGVYPPNSPYVTGNWGTPIQGLTDPRQVPQTQQGGYYWEGDNLEYAGI